mgnify:CR=1 FL=1
MERLIRELKEEEGLRLDVYLDTKGFPTVGYGCRIAVGDKINLETAEELFKYRLAQVISDFYRIPHALTKHLNDARRRVVCQMIYQMGFSGTMGFTKMWKAVEDRDFDWAAEEILNSKLACDTPNRAFRYAKIMREGRDYHDL